jgi:hypothetical protein
MEFYYNNTKGERRKKKWMEENEKNDDKIFWFFSGEGKREDLFLHFISHVPTPNIIFPVLTGRRRRRSVFWNDFSRSHFPLFSLSLLTHSLVSSSFSTKSSRCRAT